MILCSIFHVFLSFEGMIDFVAGDSQIGSVYRNCTLEKTLFIGFKNHCSLIIKADCRPKASRV